MSNVIDLASRRASPAHVTEILHPEAGVRVPIDDPACVEFLIPEVRGEISTGSYSADLVRHVSRSILPGDRVLVIGAGLGIISSQIAQTGCAERVLAVEADPRLIPFMRRLNRLNGTDWVEPVNAVLASDAWGRVPFYTSRDLRESSLVPTQRAGDLVLVPCMNLNLILADEQINTIVCDIPGASMRLLTEADLGGVGRILINCGQPFEADPDQAEFLARMARKGFVARLSGDVLQFDRSGTAKGPAERKNPQAMADCA